MGRLFVFNYSAKISLSWDFLTSYSVRKKKKV